MTEEEIFDEVVQLPPAERFAHLAHVCAEETEVRSGVERLLRLMEASDSDDFMRPPVGWLEGRAQPASGAGMQIGPYWLAEPLGEGGMGLVFRAEQVEPIRREVALKIIRPGLHTREILSRFDSERRALAMMDHPNIAKVLDAGTTADGRPYFAMELVRGTPITAFCDARHLDVAARLKLFINVCHAVEHAHSKSVIHRDLKPTNILVAEAAGCAAPKVIDFGIAKALGQENLDRTTVTGFEQIIGTPLYMSPEQADSGGLDIDTRTDVYSLGVVLYQLLTGGTPFDQSRMKSVPVEELYRILREEGPPKPSTKVAALGEPLRAGSDGRHADTKKLVRLLRGDLDWIVMKSLEKDRVRRYESVSGLAHDIQRYLNHEPVLAGPPSRLYYIRKLARRHRSMCLFAATILLLLCAGIGGTTAGLLSASRVNDELDLSLEHVDAERAQAEHNLELAQRNLYIAHLNMVQSAFDRQDIGESLALLAKYVPEQGEADLRTFAWRYWWRQCQRFEQALAHPEFVRRVAVSPDGSQLASITWAGEVRLWDTKSWDYVTVQPATGVRSNCQTIAFSPCGLLATSSNDSKIKVWKASVGDAQLVSVLTDPRGLVRSLAFSPDGTHLLSGSDDGFVRLRSLETNSEVHCFEKLHGAAFAVRFSDDGRYAGAAEFAFDGSIYVWSVKNGRLMKKFASGQATSIAFTPDGRHVAAGNTASEIRIWNLDTDEQRTLTGHRFNIESLAFSPDGSHLASSATDETVRIWDWRSGAEDRSLLGHTYLVDDVAYFPKGHRIASAGQDRTVKVWDLAISDGRFSLCDERCNSIVYVEERDAVALAMTSGTVQLRTAQTGAPIASVKIADSPILSMGMHEGQLLAVARSGEIIALDFDPLTATPVARAINGGSRQCTISGDGSRMACLDMSNVMSIQSLHLSDPPRQFTWSVDCDSVLFLGRAIGYSAVVTTDGSNVVTVWDADTGELKWKLDGHRNAVQVATLSPDGTTLCTGSRDHLAILWDMATGEKMLALRGHRWAVSAIVFLDSDTIATGGWDGSVRLWDRRTGEQQAILGEHTGPVAAMASLGPDAFVSAGRAGDMRVWRAPALGD